MTAEMPWSPHDLCPIMAAASGVIVECNDRIAVRISRCPGNVDR